MKAYTNPLFSGQRDGYVATFPREIEAHRKAQCAMFAAAKTAGLSPKTKGAAERDAAKAFMLAGINQFLGLRLTSRAQLTIPEMELITVAIEAAVFSPGWVLAPGVAARVRITITPEITEAASDFMTPDVDDPDYYAGYEEAFYQL